jgi:hypothetical protein
MKDLFKLILGILASLFKSRAKLEVEILILRQYRSFSICLALSLVPLRRWRDCDCQAGDDHSLAPRWVSCVLALAIAQPCWQTEGLDCAAHAHW